MIRVRIPPSVHALGAQELLVTDHPGDLGQLLASLERSHPGIAAALDSSAVNAAVNGEVVLSGRDRTPLHDGDEVEFLVMFAGG